MLVVVDVTDTGPEDVPDRTGGRVVGLKLPDGHNKDVELYGKWIEVGGKVEDGVDLFIVAAGGSGLDLKQKIQLNFSICFD